MYKKWARQRDGGGGEGKEGCHVDRDRGFQWDCPSFPDTWGVYGSRGQLKKKRQGEIPRGRERQTKGGKNTGRREAGRILEGLLHGSIFVPPLQSPARFEKKVQLCIQGVAQGESGRPLYAQV